MKQILKQRELYDPGSERKKSLDMSVARMIALDLQPLSVVEDQALITSAKHWTRNFIFPAEEL